MKEYAPIKNVRARNSNSNVMMTIARAVTYKALLKKIKQKYCKGNY